MNVVQCLSHSIESYDMLKLYRRIGVDAFDVGPYIDPRNPHVDMRPPSDMTYFPELKAAVDSIGAADNLGAAQERLPEALLDWADTIVFHHYLDRLWGQWDRISRWLREDSAHRVIWRTVGQSVDGNEFAAQPFVKDGLEIVRYSPKERNIPNYAGEDALIRFAKDPAEWYGWTGEQAVVGNVTQDLIGRHPYTNADFWIEATKGLPGLPAGPNSELLGGLGPLSYDEMRAYLRRIRVYLYTGTQPASYTLGLIEAMMTGVPVVSIGPKHMSVFPYGPSMFEAHEFTARGYDEPGDAAAYLRSFLDNDRFAKEESQFCRARAIDLFGIDSVAPQWAAFLDVKVPALA